MLRLGALLAVLSLTLTACSSDQEPADTANTPGTAATESPAATINPADYDLGGQPVTLAGISFTPPTAWADLGASGMRQASYAYGPVEGETDSATVTVFYFGPEGGGGIDANIERWVGQMTTGETDNPSQRAQRYTFTANELPVHVVAVNGTYSGSMGGPMSGGGIAKEDYRMIAAVVEAPEGNLFFKLTGPQKTAGEMENAFLAMLKTVKKSA